MPDAIDPPAPTVLVLHGLGGGPYELAPVIDALRGAGCRVVAPVLPGHDDSGGSRMPGSSWRAWIEAAEAAFDALAAEAEDADTGGGGKIVVVGFSTGATLALMLAGRRPVGRLVLLAPFLAIRFSRWLVVPARVWLGPIALLLPDIPRRPAAVRDRRVRVALAGSSRFRTFNLVSTLSALDLIARVVPTLGAVACPTLIVQGRRDSVVEPREAARLLARLGATDKALVWCRRSDHLLAHDHDRAAVAEAVVRFAARPPENSGGRHDSGEPPSHPVAYTQ